MKEKRDARRREVIVFDKPREGCPLWRFEMSFDANGADPLSGQRAGRTEYRQERRSKKQ
jgi:hypothetical protein